MSLSDNIKAERIKNGLSQAKLGEILNVTQQAVGKWEKGQSEPDSVALKTMATLFSVTIDELIGHKNFTPEERAAGVSETKKISVTPIEEQALNLFKKIGTKHGRETQIEILNMLEKMT